MQWLLNFIHEPKTTIAGLWGGGTVLGVMGLIAYQAHCDFSLLSWQTLAPAIIPIVAGGLMKDSKKTG